ncbi:hypothetical protein PAL_GLEAN10019094 [Pteropus alecto]|uniref:Uncharacterized protein n=1 Tax=Pteropus alecto TaxID=9402 RepID=L5KRE5_PTEAL|nr:hypothetical protein PAL_GLEAN10019094 [Pteropus alecto]
MTSGTKRQEELKQASAVRQDLAPRTAENCSSTDIHVMRASHQMPEKGDDFSLKQPKHMKPLRHPSGD